MKKYLLILLCAVSLSLLFRTGTVTAQNKDTQTTGAQAHEGISFTLPAGSWQPVPEKKSLVPYLDNKVQEQIESNSKITVVFQTTGAYGDVTSLFDSVKSAFALNWGNPSLVEKLHLISPQEIDGPRKFSAVYNVVERAHETPFRVEIVAVTTHTMVGNKGVLYIICPAYNYYDNRKLIASIRDALTLDEDAASPKQQNTITENKNTQ